MEYDGKISLYNVSKTVIVSLNDKKKEKLFLQSYFKHIVTLINIVLK